MTVVHDDRGTGQIGTIAAFTAFLLFLFLAIHVLIGLYATSAVTAAAYDGARQVASADVEHDDPGALAAAREDAEAHVRSLLGRAGATARFDWTSSSATVVALHVRVPWPRLLPAIGGPLGDARVDRTVRVRVERAP